MRINRALVALALGMLMAGAAMAHDEDEAKGQLGKVEFANSCTPKVQAPLLRGVAMLHSFWYGEGEKTFRAVLAEDPSCAIATWGIASMADEQPVGRPGRLAQGGRAGKR